MDQTTRAPRADDPVACHAFADAWRAWDGPGAVEFVTCEFPTGRHEMPKTLILPTAEQAAKADRRCERIWATAGTRLTALQTTFIGTKWLEKHRVLVLAMLGDAPVTEPDETNLGDDDAVDFAASVEDLCRWEKTPTSVVILENKETGYAFTDDLPGVVVLHGQGFSVLYYARIDWVRTVHHLDAREQELYFPARRITRTKIIDGLIYEPDTAA